MGKVSKRDGQRDQQAAERTKLTRNRLHSVLHSTKLPPPQGDPFARHNRAWWFALPVSAMERLRIRQDRATLDYLAPQIAEVDAVLRQVSTSEPWAAQVPYLMHLPG